MLLLFSATSDGDIFTNAAKYDSCKMYVPLGSAGPRDAAEASGINTCYPEFFSDNETQPCEEFVYERTFYKESLVTELDLVNSMDCTVKAHAQFCKYLRLGLQQLSRNYVSALS